MLETELPISTDDVTVYLKGYQTSAFLIERISLDFNLGEKTTLVTATTQIRRNGQHQQALVLDGEELSLKSIRLNQQALSEADYELSNNSLTIANVSDAFELEIVTELEPQLNTQLSGLYQSSGNFCTQCEAEGFRRISYYLDRPDILAVYDVKITADKKSYPVLLSNGNPVASGDNKDGTHWAQWHDPHPKPSYLFALVACDLQHISDSFTTMSGKSVTLNIYTQKHNIDLCEHAMTSLKRAMQWDEQVYGREYDLDLYNIVAVDDFNMGAMENKGLNIFNSKYVLANQQTATDSDFEGVESVIAHEYFHNWSGNRVTCRDWFQLSLKEGFTVFRDQEFSADMGSRAVKRIRDVQVLRNHQFKEDAGPMAHPIRPESYQEINNFYTVTIYEKGAEVIRMLHSILGTEGFRKGSDLYFERFDGQAVTTEDFVQSMEQANNIDLTQFRHWYTQAGTPQVSISDDYDSGVLRMHCTQSCPATPGQNDKEAFQIPLKTALFTQQGEKIKEVTLSLTQEQQSFEFDGLTDKPIVSILRGFSAPIKLDYPQSNQELATLMACDDDGFTRWEAGQRLYLNLLLPLIKDNNKQAELDESLYQLIVSALEKLLMQALQDKNTDKAIVAEMLNLPSQSYIAEQLEAIDPHRIYQVRERVAKKLAEDLQTLLLETYQANTLEEFDLSAVSMAKRALKNAVLHCLLALEKPQVYELAQQQYQTANNMTDRLAAFSGLCHSQFADKQLLIDDFYQQWQQHTLVLDKWFAIQAISPDIDLLASIKKLTEHEAFQINNPNKVRALIGAFSSNSVAFHRPDGQAYEFLADIIIQLNQINPQVGSRLASTFNSWRKYQTPYSEAMKKAISRISQTADLKKDIAEIVNKALS